MIISCDAKSSASPKPDPSKPHPRNMPQAKTEVALQFSECCAAGTALQHCLFCSAEVIWTKSCAAANEKLHRNIEKLRCRKVALSCRFPAAFKPPRLGTHVSDLLKSACFRGRLGTSCVVILPGVFLAIFWPKEIAARHVSSESFAAAAFCRVPPPKPVLEASESGIRLVGARFL